MGKPKRRINLPFNYFIQKRPRDIRSVGHTSYVKIDSRFIIGLLLFFGPKRYKSRARIGLRVADVVALNFSFV